MERAKYLFDKILKEGESAIDEFVKTRKSEELFLELKTSADNGSGEYLNQNDRKNLAKAISGFGNSEGGVIIWGVSCSKDVADGDTARLKLPIQNAKRFLSWLEGTVSGCTIPPHAGVQHRIVGERSSGEGFILTYIPKSMTAPHQSIIDFKYYIRSGSSFMPTPHSVLAGMFGKRPQPNVFHEFTAHPPEIVGTKIINPLSFIIHNDGPGIASDLFLSLTVVSIPGENCLLRFEDFNPNNWTGSIFLKSKIGLISKREVRIGPDQEIKPITVKLHLAPPFKDDLHIKGICGCGESPPYRFVIKNDCESIGKLYGEYMKKSNNGSLSPRDKDNLGKDLWISVTEERG
jgi:hypothetical protein